MTTASASQTSGSRMSMFKQDPLDEIFGVRTTFVHTKVEAGPKDSLIQIKDLPVVQPDKNGDFIRAAKENGVIRAPDTKDFDAIHTYTIVRMIVTMYERAFRALDPNFKWSWQWKGSQTHIDVYPRAGEMKNAYYSRDEKALKFFSFDHEGKQVFTCRSLDIVAHEAGHAVLDAIKPGFLISDLAQTGALHESFGDMTSILSLMSQLDVCEALIAQTKGNLYAPNFFEGMAEQFGVALGRQRALRNAFNKLKLTDVDQEVHTLSQVFTGAFYAIIVEIFMKIRNDDIFDPAESLFRVGKYVRPFLLWAIQNAPDRNATFGDVAEKMIEYAKREWDPDWVAIVSKEFEFRQILGSNRITKARKLTNADEMHCTSMNKALNMGMRK